MRFEAGGPEGGICREMGQGPIKKAMDVEYIEVCCSWSGEMARSIAKSDIVCMFVNGMNEGYFLAILPWN